MKDRSRDDSEIANLGASLRELAQEDRHSEAPARVQAAVLQAWDLRQQSVEHRKRGRRYAALLAIGSIAAGFVTVLVLERRPSPPSAPAATVARVADRPRVVDAPAVAVTPPAVHARRAPLSRPSTLRDAPHEAYERGIVLVADPILDASAIRVVRVRMPRTALPTLGIAVADLDQSGWVDLEMLVGEDGAARTIRRAMPVTVQQE